MPRKVGARVAFVKLDGEPVFHVDALAQPETAPEPELWPHLEHVALERAVERLRLWIEDRKRASGEP